MRKLRRALSSLYNVWVPQHITAFPGFQSLSLVNKRGKTKCELEDLVTKWVHREPQTNFPTKHIWSIVPNLVFLERHWDSMPQNHFGNSWQPKDLPWICIAAPSQTVNATGTNTERMYACKTNYSDHQLFFFWMIVWLPVNHGHISAGELVSVSLVKTCFYSNCLYFWKGYLIM